MEHEHEYVATTSSTTVREPLRCRMCGKPHWCLTNLSGGGPNRWDASNHITPLL